MVAGESTAVIINELYGNVVKSIKTESLSGVAILCHVGGSSRDRHLRLRAAFARQSVIAGDWMSQYVLGEVMLADIGTKALTAARLELLKRLMGMGKLNGESEEEEKKGKDEVEEKRRTGQPADKRESRLKQAAQVIKLITLAHPFRSPRLRMKKEEGRNQFHLESSSSTHHLRGPSDPDDPEALECWSTRSRIYSPTCFGSTRKSHRSNWRRRKRRCLQRRNR